MSELKKSDLKSLESELKCNSDMLHARSMYAMFMPIISVVTPMPYHHGSLHMSIKTKA